jgi:hypothetical protein
VPAARQAPSTPQPTAPATAQANHPDPRYGEEPYGAYPDPAGVGSQGPNGQAPTEHGGQSRSGLADRLRKEHGSTEGFDYWGEG